MPLKRAAPAKRATPASPTKPATTSKRALPAKRVAKRAPAKPAAAVAPATEASAARVAASRRNGARSKGPASAAGKARSAQNALRHGLRARQTVTLADEDAEAFAAFEQALQAELMPAGALQAELVARVACAAWRARRVDRLEAALLGRHLAPATTRSAATGSDAAGRDPAAALGAGLIRDGHGPRALETLVRYRGSVLAELFRGLGALQVLQTEPGSPDLG